MDNETFQDNLLLATIGFIVKHGKRTYKVSNAEVKDGDLVWNEPSKTINKCIAVIGNDIVVEFPSGLRTALWKARFQKLVLQ